MFYQRISGTQRRKRYGREKGKKEKRKQEKKPRCEQTTGERAAKDPGTPIEHSFALSIILSFSDQAADTHLTIDVSRDSPMVFHQRISLHLAAQTT